MKTLKEFKVAKVKAILGADFDAHKMEQIVEALEWADIEYDEYAHEMELFYQMEAAYEERANV